MYTYFYFEPMNDNQLKSIMWESMTQAYGGQCEFVLAVFENYCNQLIQFFSPYTSNVNEYVYLFRFLYPRYVQKFYNKLHDDDSDRDQASKVKDIVNKKGALLELFDKSF